MKVGNTMAEHTKKENRTWTGVVVSDKMDKTLVVEVTRTFRHSEFDKTLKSLKKYKVHDENNQGKMGDIVEFFEGKPMSKTKHMHLARIVTPSRIS